MALTEIPQTSSKVGILCINLFFWLVLTLLSLQILNIDYQIPIQEILKKEKPAILKLLRDISSYRDWEKLLRYQFAFFSEDIYSSEQPTSNFQSQLEAFNQTLPGKAEFIMFDEKANIIASNISFEIKYQDSKNLFYDFACLEKGFPDVLQKNVSRYDYIFKGSFPQKRIFLGDYYGKSGDIIPLKPAGRFDYIFISRFFRNGFMIGFFKKNQNLNDFVQTAIKSCWKRINSNVYLETIDPNSPIPREQLPFPFDNELAQLLSSRAEDESPIVKSSEDFILGVIGLEKKRILAGLRNSELEVLTKKHLRQKSFIIFFFLAVLFFTTYRIKAGEKTEYAEKKLFSYGIRLLIPFFLLGIPFLILRIYFQESMKDELNSAQIETEKGNFYIYQSLEFLDDPDDIFRNTLEILAEKCLFAENQPLALRKILVEASRLYSVTFQAAIFDPNENYVEEASDLKLDQQKAAKFLLAIKKVKNKEFSGLDDNDFYPLETMRDYLITFKSPKDRDIGTIQVLYRSQKTPDSEILFISPLHQRGLLILQCKMSPNWEHTLPSQIDLHLRKYYPDRFCASVDLQKMDHLAFPEFLSGKEEKKDYFSFLQNKNENKTFIGNWFCTKKLFPGNFYIITAAESKNLPFLKKLLEMFDLILILIFLLSCRFLAITKQWQNPTNLGEQLFYLLCFTTLFLLLFMSLNFRDRLEERQKFLETQIIKDQQHKLEEIDRMYLEEMQNFESQIKQELSVANRPDIELEKSEKENLQRIFEKYTPIFVSLIGANGKSVFCIGKGEQALLERTFKLIETGMERLIKELNRESIHERSDLKGQMVNMAAATFGFNADYVFSLFTQNLDKLRILDLFSTEIAIVLTQIKNNVDRVKYLAFCAWVPEVLEENYLSRVLEKFRMKGNRFGFYARTKVASKVFTTIPWITKDPKFFEFFRKRAIEIPISTVIGFPYARYFVARIPADKMRFTTMGLFVSDHEIKQELAEMRTSFLYLISGILAALLLVWIIIRKTFLQPFDDLKYGVTALQKRDFSHRVPDLGKDEFGELAFAFNRMLESIQDLEVAKTLQENIFPEEQLEKNGWVIYGKCRPTAEVGGDYFDYLEIDSTRVLFVLGDVTGHGIPAALVVGMAKAAIFHPGNSFKPETILNNLGTIISRVLKRKLLMTCLIGVFDTSLGTLTLANAGQCSPFLVGEKNAQEIKIPSLPLGAKLRSDYTSITTVLTHTDWLLTYSDGFIEARNNFGEMIGYETVAAALPNLKGQDAKETLEKLFSWQESKLDGIKHDDDTTLLVVCRKES
ncbi:MAG: SpoIIE family protein phosphatase [Candidatus Riflebacteria bacterium]|nr:SpoIIE family protein phosphatase [Candidatus Riflebacteria bacterium]